MESADLNSPSADDARLEARLRQPVPSLVDDGFTRRVLAALPAPTRAPVAAPASVRVNWMRLAVCAAGAATGWLVTRIGGAAFSTVEMKAQLQSSLAQLSAALGDPTALLGLALGVVAVLYALLPRGHSRLLR